MSLCQICDLGRVAAEDEIEDFPIIVRFKRPLLLLLLLLLRGMMFLVILLVLFGNNNSFSNRSMVLMTKKMGMVSGIGKIEQRMILLY